MPPPYGAFPPHPPRSPLSNPSLKRPFGAQTATFAAFTESTYQPVTAMLSSSPSCQRSLRGEPAKEVRSTVTLVIGPIVPLHQARFPPRGFEKLALIVPVKPPSWKAASGTTDHDAPPFVDASSVPPS